MTLTLFIIGLLTALGCGVNVMGTEGTWAHELIWILGGFGGAGLMILAIAISRGAVF